MAVEEKGRRREGGMGGRGRPLYLEYFVHLHVYLCFRPRYGKRREGRKEVVCEWVGGCVFNVSACVCLCVWVCFRVWLCTGVYVYACLDIYIYVCAHVLVC